MKKFLLILALTLGIGGTAWASSINGDYNGHAIVKIVVDGKTINPEVPGHIVDGSTMLPLRAVSEALGAKVDWDQAQYQATVTMPQKAISPTSVNLTQEAIDRISKSIARIYVYDSADKPLGQGSGFIIDDGVHGKMLITACHVGCSGPNLRVEVNGQTLGVRNAPLFKNEQADIIGYKIETTAPSIPYVRALPNAGDVITEIGFPKTSYGVSTGTINVISQYEGMTYLFGDTKSDIGGSGSPLLNAKGEVIGIVVSGNDVTKNSDSVPFSYVQQELDKL